MAALRKTTGAHIVADTSLSAERLNELLLDPQNPLSKAYQAALLNRAEQRISAAEDEFIAQIMQHHEELQLASIAAEQNQYYLEAQEKFNAAQARYNEAQATAFSSSKPQSESGQIMSNLVAAIAELGAAQAKLANIQTERNQASEQWQTTLRTIAKDMGKQLATQEITVAGQKIPCLLSAAEQAELEEKIAGKPINRRLLAQTTNGLWNDPNLAVQRSMLHIQIMTVASLRQRIHSLENGTDYVRTITRVVNETTSIVFTPELSSTMENQQKKMSQLDHAQTQAEAQCQEKEKAVLALAQQLSLPNATLRLATQTTETEEITVSYRRSF